MANNTQFEALTPSYLTWEDSNGIPHSLYCDAAVRQRHESSVTITEHPIELGASVTDHAIVDPRFFTLTGRISSIPFREYEDDLTGVSNRPESAWQILQDLLFSRVFVTVYSNLKTYSNLLLKNVSAEQDWQTSRVLDFEAVFREVFTVELPFVFVPGAERPLAVVPSKDSFDQAYPLAQRGMLTPSALQIQDFDTEDAKQAFLNSYAPR